MDFMTKHDEPPNLESLVAQLTEAAYPIALRHRGRGSWVDLELDLWKALGQTLSQWQRQQLRPQDLVQVVGDTPEAECAHESQ